MISAMKTEEAGFRSAMHGLALSKKQPVENMPALAKKLAFKDGGHNKFLESMIAWFEVRAPRYWWQEGDTYRISSKQSESTMHTLINEIKAIDHCDREAINAYLKENFEPCSVTADQYKLMAHAAHHDDITGIKRLMPEGFLQRRVWTLSYKTIRNMILQRRNHRLPLWPSFLNQVLDQLNYPDYLPGVKVKA